jgi:adenosyl cobinamide kinase/adenosyl cobinamide phosphate guanylyltransferase
MFQRLDQLRTGSMYIITGQAGAGKSHLAASARRSGTVWVLDTEGASQNLINKPGIHRDIQAVQSLSLRQLLDAMREVKRIGKPGDTVILDSISKVLQAMRSYAQQRAGAETDRKASLSYDEHASVNRNMQAIYTGLTELKHGGFHVIIIGHLAKKYQTNGSSLSDVGLRVLADENITYEADAVLLVERNGARRSVTPIIKPPRQRHLQINQEYPATLATLYPDQAVEEETPVAVEGTSEAPTNVSQFPTDEARTSAAPKTAREAERRFYARYGTVIGGTTWEDVETFLGYPSTKPKTVEEWVEVAGEVKAKIGDAELAA